jgi:hypothetical protein
LKRIIFTTIIFIFSISSCSVSADENKSEKVMDIPRAENECPKGNHTDSIIPIIYGFPTEENFRKSDSSLVALGGCELPEKPSNYWCKIHQIDF